MAYRHDHNRAAFPRIRLALFVLAIIVAGTTPSHASASVESPGVSTASLGDSDRAISIFTPENWYLDAVASWGVSKSAFDGGAGSPTLSQIGLGATAAWKVSPHLFVGLSNDVRSAGQYSDFLSSVGEISGHRLNWLAPTAGVVWRDFVLKFDLQWLGDYRLEGSGDDRSSIALGRPRGWRLSALYPMLHNLHIGAQLETVAYSSESRNGEATRLLERPVGIWQVALTTGLVF